MSSMTGRSNPYLNRCHLNQMKAAIRRKKIPKGTRLASVGAAPQNAPIAKARAATVAAILASMGNPAPKTTKNLRSVRGLAQYRSAHRHRRAPDLRYISPYRLFNQRGRVPFSVLELMLPCRNRYLPQRSVDGRVALEAIAPPPSPSLTVRHAGAILRQVASFSDKRWYLPALPLKDGEGLLKRGGAAGRGRYPGWCRPAGPGGRPSRFVPGRAR